jgi:hypothetical protein
MVYPASVISSMQQDAYSLHVTLARNFFFFLNTNSFPSVVAVLSIIFHPPLGRDLREPLRSRTSPPHVNCLYATYSFNYNLNYCVLSTNSIDIYLCRTSHSLARPPSACSFHHKASTSAYPLQRSFSGYHLRFYYTGFYYCDTLYRSERYTCIRATYITLLFFMYSAGSAAPNLACHSSYISFK